MSNIVEGKSNGVYYIEMCSIGIQSRNIVEITAIIPSFPSASLGLTGSFGSYAYFATPTITWNSGSNNTTGYYVYRYDNNSGSNWNLISTLPATTMSFTDTSSVISSSYLYQVVSYNADGTSPLSPTSSIVIPIKPTLPTTDLFLWNDASQITGINNGASCSYWQDLSGNGNHWTASAANSAPAYFTNSLYQTSTHPIPCLYFSADGFNGFPPGVTTYLSAITPANWSSASFSGSCEIFITQFRYNGNDPANVSDIPAYGIGGLWTITSNDFTTHLPFSDGKFYDGTFATTRNVGYVNSQGSTNFPVSTLTKYWQTYQIMSSASLWKSWTDSTLLFSGSNTFKAPYPEQNNIVLGTNFAGAWRGYIAEIIIYRKALSSATRKQVMTYLQNKYTTLPWQGHTGTYYSPFPSTGSWTDPNY